MRTTMRAIANVVERLQQMPRLTKVLSESRGLINTTDLLVATAATVILAAGVGSAAIGTISEAKYGKAQPDAQALSSAITQFYKDTGKWPGQFEHAGVALVATKIPARFLASSNASVFLPTLVVGSVNATSVTETTCGNSSLEGFPGKTIAAGTLTTDSLLPKTINDYLVTNPGTDYPNWKGPYLTGGAIEADPWNRAWVFNLQALYCAEDVASTASVAASTGTTLGNAWVLTAGNNRTLTTLFVKGGLDNSGDDAGTNMGKLVTQLTVQ
jgi:hypothetical protein